MAAIRHLEICYVHVWTTHDEYLVVLITVRNLVGIDASVDIKLVWLENSINAPNESFRDFAP